MVWYPAGEQVRPVLEISHADKQHLASTMKGTPVIWNHKGTDSHLETGHSFEKLSETTPIHGSIGSVKDAWVDADGNGRAVIEVQPRMGALLGTNAAPGVSLSHGFDANDKPVSVEMSVVTKPARKGATIRRVFNSPAAARDYIQRAHAASNTTMETTATTPAAVETPAVTTPSPVELGVNSISNEEHRNAVTTRMEEMATVAMDKQAELTRVKAELDRYQKMAGADAAATREALDLWMNTLGDNIAERWRVNTLAGFDQANMPTNHVRSIVMASHDRITQLERQLENQGAPATKRARKEPVNAAKAPQSAIPAAAQSNPLRSALASTFHA